MRFRKYCTASTRVLTSTCTSVCCSRVRTASQRSLAHLPSYTPRSSLWLAKTTLTHGIRGGFRTTAVLRQSSSSSSSPPPFSPLLAGVSSHIAQPSVSTKNVSSSSSGHSQHQRSSTRANRGGRGVNTRNTQSSSEERSPRTYVFPVGRALRYLRRGQRHQFQVEGAEEVRAWMVDHALLNGNTDTLENEDVREVQEADVNTEDVAKFTKYHAHQVLVAFKALRRHLFHQQTATQGKSTREKQQTRKNSPTAAGGATVSSPTPGASSVDTAALLSAHDTDALTSLLFAATVLLHVGGLYGVADTHVEPLIDICFSASIFLAQSAAATAVLHSRGTRSGSSSSHARQQGRAFGDFLEAEASRGQRNISGGDFSGSQRALHASMSHGSLHSLHWSVVHFAAAVRHWGLMEHTAALQDVRKTQRPYERLLQAHAALLCESTRHCVDHVVWHELLLLKTGRRAPEARAAWFLGADAEHYEQLFPVTGNKSIRRIPARLQQRRLQLLPLLWLSLLTTQLMGRREVNETAKAVGRAAASTRGETKHDCAVVDAPMVDWGSARHAFTSLLPLFAHGAGLDVTSWAVVHLLFVPGTHNASERVSLPEMCAVVSRIERGGAARELGELLPLTNATTAVATTITPGKRCNTSHDSPGSSVVTAETQVHAQLSQLLRRFLDEAATVERDEFAAAVAKRGTPTNGSARKSVADTSSFSSPSAPTAARVVAKRRALFASLSAAPSSAVRQPVQLYRAIANIPLSALHLPATGAFPSKSQNSSPHVSADTLAGATLPVTAAGLRLANSLLLRVLLQWRPDTGGLPALPVPKKPASGFSSTEAVSGEGGERDARPAHESNNEHSTLTVDVASNDDRNGSHRLLQWRREVFDILQAAQQLRLLLHHATTSVDSLDQCPATNSDAVLDRSKDATLATGILTMTVQTAARALAEQLGSALLPRRAALSALDNAALTSTEVKVLESIDAEFRHILQTPLMGKGDGGSAASAVALADSVETCVGALPKSYLAASAGLLKRQKGEPEWRNSGCKTGLVRELKSPWSA